MTHRALAFMFITLTLVVQGARADAECEKGCFDTYRECREAADVFFTSGLECGEEQTACRFSCNSGKKMDAYRPLGAFSYSFRPILDEAIKL